MLSLHYQCSHMVTSTSLQDYGPQTPYYFLRSQPQLFLGKTVCKVLSGSPQVPLTFLYAHSHWSLASEGFASRNYHPPFSSEDYPWPNEA